MGGRGDRRQSRASKHALFGALLQERTLLPSTGALIFQTRFFEDWATGRPT
jgi:hypothetical protein